MTLSRRAIVSVALGLGLGLAGCSSPTSPTSGPPPPPPPAPTAKVTVTVSSVTKATIAPEKFSYTFRFQLTDSGGVASTVTSVNLAFDGGWSDYARIIGDQLGQNRRLTANGALDLELTHVPVSGFGVGNQVLDVEVEVTLADDNGNAVRAMAYIDLL